MRSFFDTITSRIGVAAGIVILVASFATSAIYFLREFDELRNERTDIEGSQMREAFVALSDLQRINLIIMSAIREGGMTPERERQLAAAIDFLFVRSDGFRRNVLRKTDSAAGREALGAMTHVISLVDQADEDGYHDLDALSEGLFVASDEARRQLFVFLDELRNLQDATLEDQRSKLAHQSVLLVAFLLFLTLMGSAALLLLKREVRMRKDVEDAQGRAEYLAFYDALTGLPNRTMFNDHVTRCLKTGRPAAMVFTDLDRFKEINDTQGHAIGDAVLRAVASRLASAAEAADGMAARLAGDEFAMFLPVEDMDTLSVLATKIIRECSKPVWSESEKVVPSISIGIATTGMLPAELSPTFESLVRVADFALYASKSGGRGRYTFFDAEVEAKFTERRSMLMELPDAIRNRDVQIYLQPKVMLEDARTYGFEALARWQRNGEIVRPSEFIELAETSGTITDLDIYVLRAATALVAESNRLFGDDYSVSVNLSGIHFRSAAIVEDVQDALHASGLPPELLTLEITETVQIVNWDQVSRIFAALRALGCRIAIDDFGSGYCSLAYLRAMEADELKIDRSLVSEIESSEEARYIFDAVIDLAQSLKMDVVVEGVETDSQVRTLTELGCSRAQGYYFGHPAPALAAFELGRATRVNRPARAAV